jgi:uncharacterized membrane protein
MLDPWFLSAIFLASAFDLTTHQNQKGRCLCPNGATLLVDNIYAGGMEAYSFVRRFVDFYSRVDFESR